MTNALLAITQPPARLGDHVVGALVTTAVIVGLWAAMRRGWRGRLRRQAAFAAPLPVDAAGEASTSITGPTTGTYLGTTLAGKWLERVVAHGLGTRSAAALTVTATGVRLDRVAAPSFAVLAPDVLDVRTDRAHAGRLSAEDAVVVLGWRLGGTVVETGFRPEDPADAQHIVAALRPFVEVHA